MSSDRKETQVFSQEMVFHYAAIAQPSTCNLDLLKSRDKTEVTWIKQIAQNLFTFCQY